MTALNQVVSWIRSINDPDTLNAVLGAVHGRYEWLGQQRADLAVKGAQVVLGDTGHDCLDGLSGVIVGVDEEEGTVAVRLSAESTGRLRFSRQATFDTGSSLTFLVDGIPAECCYDSRDIAGVPNSRPA